LDISCSITRLTGGAISDDKDADGLVLESRILDLRNVNIQDLLEPGTSRCLACGGVSNESADGANHDLPG